MIEGSRKRSAMLQRQLTDGIKHHQIALHAGDFRGYADILGGEALLDQVAQSHIGLRRIEVDGGRAFIERHTGLGIRVAQRNTDHQAGQKQPLPFEQDAADIGERQPFPGGTPRQWTVRLYCDRRYLMRGIHYLRRLSGVPSTLRRARPVRPLRWPASPDKAVKGNYGEWFADLERSCDRCRLATHTADRT